MKQFFSSTLPRIGIIAVSVVVVGFAVLYFMPAQAVSVETVGSISVRLYPIAGSGSEFVTLTYSGPGEADLTGWTLSSASGFSHDLSGVVLKNGVAVKICEEGSEQSGCGTYQWEGNDVFVDEGDTVIFEDHGAAVATLVYDASSPIPVPESMSYKTEVYAKNSKVKVCHLDGKGAYRGQNVNAGNIIRVDETGKSGHATHEGDIIPSFIHNVNGSFEYYEGKAWPDETGEYEGC